MKKAESNSDIKLKIAHQLLAWRWLYTHDPLFEYVPPSEDQVISVYQNNPMFNRVVNGFSVYISSIVEEQQKPLQYALRVLIIAAKAMPESPHTPSQMALDDAIEAAEEVMKEVE